VFGAFALALLALYHFPYEDGSPPRQLTGAYLRACAGAAGALLAPLDPAVRVDGVLIRGRFPLRVVRSCDAADAMALLAAAVAAFPASWRRRLAGLSLGLGVLFTVNAVRIASLYLLGASRPELFAVAHEDLWPPVLLSVAVLLFLVWASLAQGAVADDPAPA
jgi:exosortase/archaeosortase family protein